MFAFCLSLHVFKKTTESHHFLTWLQTWLISNKHKVNLVLVGIYSTKLYVGLITENLFLLNLTWLN